MSKLKNLPALKKIIHKLKKQGKTIVFTNGCFDIIHPGHIKTFQFAKKKGDILVLGLNSDVSVKKIKGKARPILNQRARAQVLCAIDAIDYVTVFNEITPYQLIKVIRPDILLKGSDWKRGKIIGREFAKKVMRVPLKKGYSTSKIIKKIIKANA